MNIYIIYFILFFQDDFSSLISEGKIYLWESNINTLGHNQVGSPSHNNNTTNSTTINTS